MMNYDKIILELLSRVQTLESQMADVKVELAVRYEEDADDENEEEVDGHEGYTRSAAREKAMEIIQKKFPDYLVDKASRKEGSGIKVFKPDTKRPVIIKFYHSKSFKHRSGNFEHGWHVLRIDDVIGTVVDLCLFSMVDAGGNWNFFIYEPDEIGIYNEENRSNVGNVLHLYFSVQNDKAIEVREETIDVTDYLNNWNVLE